MKRKPKVALRATGAVGGIIGAAVGGLALASRLGRSVPRLERTLDAEPRTFSWHGHDVVYYVRGQGDPVVLLHSINAAASAYEMREPFRRLAGDHQVYAPDLLGFGASERPDIPYTAELYQALLASFLREVVGRRAHVIASSLSGAHAAACAASRPDLFHSLVLVNPTGLVTLSHAQGSLGRTVQRLFTLPVLGEGMFKLLVSWPSLTHFLGKAYGGKDRVPSAVIEQNYLTAHQPNARFAPAAFIGRALDADLSDVLPRLLVHTLLVWSHNPGYQDTAEERDAFLRRNPRLQAKTMPSEGGLPHDEQPDQFVKLVREFIGPSNEEPYDAVDESSMESFPASDAPAH